MHFDGEVVNWVWHFRESTSFSFQARVPAEKTLSRPTDMCWLSELISPPVGIGVGFCSGTNALKKVMLPAGVTLGTTSGSGRASGWARLDVNRSNLMETALAADLQRSALARVLVSSCGKYTIQFNMFVAWYGALMEPRASLPASDATVAMYLQSVMYGPKTFAPMNTASAAIVFY